ERTRPQGPGEYGGWVDIEVKDSALIDFVAMDRALRDMGLVASRMEFGGVEHFRFEAQAKHLCCKVCEDAAQRLTELSHAMIAGRLGWVDSVSVHSGHRVVVYARYLPPSKTVDVSELLAAMEQVGLLPL